MISLICGLYQNDRLYKGTFYNTEIDLQKINLYFTINRWERRDKLRAGD